VNVPWFRASRQDLAGECNFRGRSAWPQMLHSCARTCRLAPRRRCGTQAVELGRQLRQLPVRVEPARVGQQPHPRRAEGGLLRPDRGARRVERHAVRGDPDDREPPRTQPLHQRPQAVAAGAQLRVAQLVGPCRRSVHHVRDAQPEGGQLTLLRGQQAARGEPAQVQRGPEPVAGPAEMVPGQRRDEAGVDAAEQHGARRVVGSGEQVGHGQGARRLQRGTGRAGHRATVPHPTVSPDHAVRRTSASLPTQQAVCRVSTGVELSRCVTRPVEMGDSPFSAGGAAPMQREVRRR
jgi:hypothetical protein